MHRILILGRGAAGKSTLARRLGKLLDLPVTELDTLFWSPTLTPTPPARWTEIQRHLIAPPRWLLDGDLGPHDTLQTRLTAADTVLILNFPLWRCTYRALRRSPESLPFWRWLLTYRRHHLPAILSAIATHAPEAEVHLFRRPREVELFMGRVGDRHL